MRISPQSIIAVISVLVVISCNWCMGHALPERDEIDDQIRMGITYRQGKNYTNAREIFEQLLEQCPGHDNKLNAKLLYELGATCRLEGDHVRASEAFNQFLEQDDGQDWFLTARTLYGLGMTHRKQDDPVNARLVFNRLLEHYHGRDIELTAKTLYELGATCRNDKDYSNALRNFNQLLEQYSKYDERLTARTLYGIGMTYKEQGDLVKAHEYFSQFLEGYSDEDEVLTSKVLFELGATCFREKNYTKARQIFEQLIEQTQGRDVIMSAKSLCRLGAIYRAEGDYVNSIKKYERVLEMSPAEKEMLSAYTGLVRCFARSGHDTKAQEITALLLSQFNRTTDIQRYMFEIAEDFFSSGQEHGDETFYLRSIEILEKVDFQAVDDLCFRATIFYMLGLNFQQLHDYAMAAEAFGKVCQIDPTHQYAAFCLFSRGRCYDEMIHRGEIPEEEGIIRMRLIFEEVVRTYPSTPEARESQRWLDENN